MRNLWIVLIGLVLVVAGCGDGAPDDVADGETGSPTPTETVTGTPTDAASPTDEPAAEDPCARYEPGSQVTDEAVLAVSSPSADAEFTSGSTVTGCTNAFEATFQWELLDADGQVVASGFETATCGSGCLGTFEFTVEYEVDAAQEGTLRVFTESAEDGSVQDETLVPVDLVP